MAQGMLSPPGGFSNWEDFYRARAANPELHGGGPSMRPSYPNRFTEAVATNPLTGLLVPGAEQFLQRGGRPSLLDTGLAAADVALPAIPLAGIVKKFRGKKAGKKGGEGKGEGKGEGPGGPVLPLGRRAGVEQTTAEPWSEPKRSLAEAAGMPTFEEVGLRRIKGEMYVRVRDNRTGVVSLQREVDWRDAPDWAEEYVDDEFREIWEELVAEALDKEYPPGSDEWKDLVPWYQRVTEETGIGAITSKSTRKELLTEMVKDSSVHLFDFGPYSGWVSPKGKKDYFSEEIVDWLYKLVNRHHSMSRDRF